MKKRILSVILTAVLAVSAIGCGSSEDTTQAPAADTQTEAVDNTATEEKAAETTETAQEETSTEPKILKAAASFAYPILDVHKEYYGWYTSIYGISEALFKMNENMSAESCLAKDAAADGNVWTITLNDGVAFSNGTALTAEMVIKNLQRVAEVNERFAYLADFEMTAVDDKTLTIDTKEVYPTLRNDLASPGLGMIDLDATTDYDNAPVCRDLSENDRHFCALKGKA